MEIYAPSLRSFPADSMLVMATLPVVDWNDCLLRDLRSLDKQASIRAYAAMVMIDPFACWEDFADLLKEARISGVTNFPPASIIEQATDGMPINSGLELELRRMEWFASLGFKILFVAAKDSEITMAETRLGAHLEGIVYLPEEALARRICDEMGLISLGQQASSMPRFSFLHATTSQQTRRKK
ncbi:MULTISPECIES: hypothetical protein [Bradyrhizobium]|uniref:TIM-barrel domain-containing protein n=1 Tax=Bradyrhizobium zhengyangense TaxID=2911009 RepID=A0A9X1RD04_9BRAD|nr:MULTISPECIES: hypothetical protein [Bradyrhizobium]MCG2631957.1 hypothetical protein [Bradyrhizobium zhengyangense]MCG2645012.1 hypothetical protein [Bradyrhizobium zhengyangense]MCG2672750.1 hypothetical protein [Bradyrhizobium zhengyangense]MDN4985399.1 hypothetical protein [Bradyrhizobium sp. WYCCWR 13022]MDN5002370.1 hypothetical protein [Bradyrhizobium sp. WYCCWR 12677]